MSIQHSDMHGTLRANSKIILQFPLYVLPIFCLVISPEKWLSTSILCKTI